jgi:hypothetical protein
MTDSDIPDIAKPLVESVVGDVTGHHARPGLQEQFGYPGADPHGRAGDDCCFPGESFHELTVMQPINLAAGYRQLVIASTLTSFTLQFWYNSP